MHYFYANYGGNTRNTWLCRLYCVTVGSPFEPSRKTTGYCGLSPAEIRCCGMDVAELEACYWSLTEDELLRLAAGSSQLSPEANVVLQSELSRRGVSQEQIESYRSDRKEERKAEKTLSVERVPTVFPSLRGVFETLKDWQEYRRETGNWPSFTIAFSFLHLAGDLGFLAFFMWCNFR